MAEKKKTDPKNFDPESQQPIAEINKDVEAEQAKNEQIIKEIKVTKGLKDKI